MLKHKTRLNLYVLLAFLITITACDMFGGDNNNDDNSPPNASVTASTTDPVVGDTVRLDATKSSDPDGDKLTFGWTLETPDGSNTALSAQTAIDPQFIPDTSGNYTARLEVDDGSLTGSDDLIIEAEEDEPDSVTVKANLSTTDNGTLANCVTEFTPESGDTITKNTCTDPAAQFAQNSGTVTVNATADDYQQMEKTTATQRDRTLEFALEPETPDQSTVTFAATEADTLVSIQVFVADTLAADGEKPTASFPYGETIDARIEAQFMKTKTITFTADQAEQTESTVLKRKSAEIFVSPQDSDGNVLSDATTVIHEPDGVDSTEITGEGAAMLAQRSGDRAVAVTNITERADKPDRLTRFEPFSTTVSASEDADLRPNMKRLAACNDGIDNDPNDDLVDVWEDTNGDGRPSKGDAGDPGCIDPQDDNEGHTILQRTTGGSNANKWVANAEEQREEFLIDRSGNPLDESAYDAIGGVLLGQDFKRETSESCEDFAMELKTGPENNLDTVNITSIKEDVDTLAGRATAGWLIPKSWFDTGLAYRVRGLHASSNKLEEDQIDYPNDCLGRLDFAIKEGDGFWGIFLSWTVEEEDFDGFENSTAKTFTHRKQGRICKATSSGKTCTKVSKKGYLKR